MIDNAQMMSEIMLNEQMRWLAMNITDRQAVFDREFVGLKHNCKLIR